MKRLLITGASGTLGRELARQALRDGWAVAGSYHQAPLDDLPIDWQRLDVADAVAVDALVRSYAPDAIVHTVAVMRGPRLWPVTATGAAHVAHAAVAAGARLVHISSDAVFDGQAAPYDEAAQPSPITPYGAAKAAAETVVAALHPGAAIVRTSLIMSSDPLDQHARLILDLIAGRRSEHLFTDEYRCPIAVSDLASAVLELAADDFRGILNVAGADAVSRYELGCLVARAHGQPVARVPAATLAESGLHRPADVRLALALARSRLRTRLRGVRELFGG